MYHEVEKAVKEEIQEYPTLHRLSKIAFDQNVNLAERFDSEEDKEYYDILDGYKSQLKFQDIHLIHAVFFEAILENKLTFEVLMDFIEKHCWYGKNLPKRLPGGQTVMYNWLGLIAPAIKEYFRQMGFCFADPTNVPNFVLSLDSLTLKIEGLFRDLGRLHGAGTSRQKKKSDRNIGQEKDITALLHENAIKKLFDEDDLLFFKFLLVEKLGCNLRHDIAHALLLFPEEYNLDYMHLVLLALLRLGKCDLPENSDASSDE